MSRAGDAFRRYQHELLDSLRTRLRELTAQRGEQSVTLSSLGQDFVRYVRATEGSLYPAVAPLLLRARCAGRGHRGASAGGFAEERIFVLCGPGGRGS
jgi:hypothetical protein